MSEPFVGEIRMFAGNFAPRGWTFCDGQLLAVSQNNALFSLFGTICETPFIRGDGNGDGNIGVADVIYILAYIFQGGPGPCLDALDANDDQSVSITDAYQLVCWMFCADAPSPPPPPPYPHCYTDIFGNSIGCDSVMTCP